MTLAYVSEDGEEGYPGKVTVRCRYELHTSRMALTDLKADAARPGGQTVTAGVTAADPTDLDSKYEDNRRRYHDLRIFYEMVGADENKLATPLNVTNHSFFNLHHDHSVPITQTHKLALACDAYLPTGEGMIPVGEARKVEGTPFDFCWAEYPADEEAAKDGRQAETSHGFNFKSLGSEIEPDSETARRSAKLRMGAFHSVQGSEARRLADKDRSLEKFGKDSYVEEDNDQLRAAGGYDHCFLLADEDGVAGADAAYLEDPLMRSSAKDAHRAGGNFDAVKQDAEQTGERVMLFEKDSDPNELLQGDSAGVYMHRLRRAGCCMCPLDSGAVAPVSAQEPRTLQMEVWTSEPAMQVYTGNFLGGANATGNDNWETAWKACSAAEKSEIENLDKLVVKKDPKSVGKDGCVYGRRTAVCFETQQRPDGCNQFPEGYNDVYLRPGQVRRSCTVYRFFED